MMGASKGAAAMGFLAGIGVAIACSARSMSGSVDAGPADSPTVDTPAATPDAAAVDPPSLDRVRVRTADTDVEQQVEKETSISGSSRAVADGPVIITDIWTTDSRLGLFEAQLRGDPDCGSQVTRPHFAERRFTGPLHGVRIVLNAGEYLCMREAGNTGAGVIFQWSGYRPYPAN